MEELNETFWSTRYQTNETGWDFGQPTSPLKEYINSLTNKDLKILMPGAGNAHEAEYLWKQGFKNVVVIDIAKEPLQNFTGRVEGFPKEQAIYGDFFTHTGSYDLILEQTFFCAINPSLRAAYAKQMHNLLADDGKLAGVVFNAPMNEDKPPFGGTDTEYRTYFEPYFNFNIYEACLNSIAPRAGREWFIELQKI